MKIGLFFGSFNPIHIGHLVIANTMATSTDLEQVWFIVSPQNPFNPFPNPSNPDTKSPNLHKPSMPVTVVYLKDSFLSG